MGHARRDVGCTLSEVVCVREREEQRVAARAREAEVEGRLREAAAQASELRAKLRPVEEYQASDREEHLKRAAAGLDASKQRLEANEDRVKVCTSLALLCHPVLDFFLDGCGSVS